MAKINTTRAPALRYNGCEVKFLRDVLEGEPAYNADTPQVVVELEGVELYFYADEVDKNDTEHHLHGLRPEPDPNEDRRRLDEDEGNRRRALNPGGVLDDPRQSPGDDDVRRAEARAAERRRLASMADQPQPTDADEAERRRRENATGNTTDAQRVRDADDAERRRRMNQPSPGARFP